MSNFRSGIRDDIYDLVEAADANIQVIFSSEKANRIDWRQLVQRGEQGASGDTLDLPFVVVLFEPMNPANYGASNDSYEWPVTIYYVLSTVGRSATQLEIALDNAATLIRQALRGYTGTKFTLKEKAVAIDDSVMMEANQTLTQYNHPMQCVALRFTLICGERRS